MRVNEGDAFNRVLLDRSRQRIQASRLLPRREGRRRPTARSPIVQSSLSQCRKQSTGELAFAAGYSSTESFLFDATDHRAQFARPRPVPALRASTSPQRQQLDLRFTEPHFMGRDIAAGFDLYSLRTDFLDQSSFENQSTGIGLRFGFPLSDRTSLGLDLFADPGSTPQIANVLVDIDGDTVNTANDIVDQCDRRILCASAPVRPGGHVPHFALRLHVQLRSPQRPSPTRRAALISQFSQDVAGLGGEVNYLRTELQGGIYYGLGHGFRLSLPRRRGLCFRLGRRRCPHQRPLLQGRFIVPRLRRRRHRPPATEVRRCGPATASFNAATPSAATLSPSARCSSMFRCRCLNLLALSAALFTDFGTVGIVDRSSRQTVDLIGPDKIIVDDSFESSRLRWRVGLLGLAVRARCSSTSRTARI